MNKIDELEKQMKKIQNEIEKLKNEKTENKRWRAEAGKAYANIFDEPILDVEREYLYDDNMYLIGNYFKNEEDAIDVIKYLKIRMKLIELAYRLNEGQRIDWYNGDQKKYYLLYKKSDNKIYQDYNFYGHQTSTIYCWNCKWIDYAKKEIGEKDLIFYLSFDWDKIYF